MFLSVIRGRTHLATSLSGMKRIALPLTLGRLEDNTHSCDSSEAYLFLASVLNLTSSAWRYVILGNLEF